MDYATADALRRLNNDFYRRCAASFSQTRQAPWEGWRACLPFLREAVRGSADGGELALLDLASGNGRFETFLASELPNVELHMVAADACAELMDDAPDACERDCAHAQANTRVRADAHAPARVRADAPAHAHAHAHAVTCSLRFDALAALLRDASWNELASAAPASPESFSAEIDGVAPSRPDAEPPRSDAAPVGFDAAVSFGFFHHIPSFELRAQALRELVGLVRPGGTVIVSLWCFLEDERLARKAERSHPVALAELGERLAGEWDSAVSKDAAWSAGTMDLAAATLPATSAGAEIPAAPEAPADAAAAAAALAARLEPGDRFLGWQDAPGLWRYCHSFDDAEADALVASVADKADEIGRFRADGKSGKLNMYLAFRKH